MVERHTIDANLARSRFDEPNEAAAKRCLPAAALPHDSERAAAPDLEVDAVDGADGQAVTSQTSPDREMHLEVFDFDQDAIVELSRSALNRLLDPSVPSF